MHHIVCLQGIEVFVAFLYSLSIAWRHCNFGYLQTLTKTYFSNKYFDAIQICFELPTDALGL